MQVFNRERPAVVFGVFFTVVAVGFLLDGLGWWSIRLVYLWPVTLIVVGVSVLLGHAGRAEVERSRTRRLTRAEERVRIARELHDIVAHSVSLMTVQITAARRIMSKRPEQAEQALASAEEIGRQSLSELRNIVGVLRSDGTLGEGAHNGAAELEPMPGLDEIASLVQGFKEAGLDVGLKESGELNGAPAPGRQLTVYRIIQEALTNVLRHSPQSKVQVGLVYKPDVIKVMVVDDGSDPSVAAKKPGEGHGLIGMRERVQALGGSIEAGPNPSGPGWGVRAEVPIT